MIRLYFEPPRSEANWQSWIADCQTAIDEMDQSPSHREVRQDLYKRMRTLFLAATDGKCAYCELKLAPGQRAGDVEHYRPKGRVRDEDGQIVKVSDSGVTLEHPGYYWLAYDWRNLLPACSACNRRAVDIASGVQTGKGEIFPTLNHWWASKPEEIDREQPALLNPWVDNPEDHLTFDPDTGLVGGRTERGRTTIKVLGLNRDGLPEARRRAAEHSIELFAAHLNDKTRGVVDRRRLARIVSIADGSEEYAAACVSAIRAAWARIFDGDPPKGPPELDHAAPN